MHGMQTEKYFNQTHLEFCDLTGKEKPGNGEIPNCKTVPGRILSLPNTMNMIGGNVREDRRSLEFLPKGLSCS